MVKSYIYRILGKGKFKVTRIDESMKRGVKGRLKEYLVDLSGGDVCCDCEGFYYTKERCKHIKFVLSQLAEKKGGILDYERKGDYERLINSLK